MQQKKRKKNNKNVKVSGKYKIIIMQYSCAIYLQAKH